MPITCIHEKSSRIPNEYMFRVGGVGDPLSNIFQTWQKYIQSRISVLNAQRYRVIFSMV
jgi:hypothetical protein